MEYACHAEAPIAYALARREVIILEEKENNIEERSSGYLSVNVTGCLFVVVLASHGSGNVLIECLLFGSAFSESLLLE